MKTSEGDHLYIKVLDVQKDIYFPSCANEWNGANYL